MRRWIGLAAVLALAVGMAGAASNVSRSDAQAGDSERLEAKRGSNRYYDVTITNITRNQQFTPLLVASHSDNARIFQVGQPAGSELEALAEFGDTTPLAAKLMASGELHDATMSAGLLNPGQSVTVTVKGGRDSKFSVASMLIPTNDAFVALNAVDGPGRRGSVSYRAVAYDAGTEINDELCASIPGPDFVECGGPGSGGSPEGGEEGFVHVHAGIHGLGDLYEAERDWRNPVASIRITAVRGPGQNDEDGDDDDDDDA